jgi:hypothetical protein
MEMTYIQFYAFADARILLLNEAHNRDANVQAE